MTLPEVSVVQTKAGPLVLVRLNGCEAPVYIMERDSDTARVAKLRKRLVKLDKDVLRAAFGTHKMRGRFQVFDGGKTG